MSSSQKERRARSRKQSSSKTKTVKRNRKSKPAKPETLKSGDAGTTQPPCTSPKSTEATDLQELSASDLQFLLKTNFENTDEDSPRFGPAEVNKLEPKLEQDNGNWSSRAIKSLIGVVLVATVGWLPAQRLLQVSSVEAVVNARLVTIRAPIAGVVGGVPENTKVGEEISDGVTLLKLTNPRADRTRLDNLHRELEHTTDDREPVLTRLRHLKALYADLEGQVRQFQDGRIRQLEARSNALAAEIVAAEARRDQANSAHKRLAPLHLKGVVSGSMLEEALRDMRVTEETAKALAARRNMVLVELEAVRSGSFIGDSYNDRPRSAQRLDEISQQIITLKAELKRLDQRASRLKKSLSAEKLQHDKLSRAEIRSPIRGRIWEVLTAPGEQVIYGQTLLRLLDCSGAVVTAAVSEAVYNQLSLGTPARFRFREGGKDLRGHVVQLTGVATAPANLAILPSSLTKESYRVMVAITDLASGKKCQVGRTGRVIFEKMKPSGLRPS